MNNVISFKETPTLRGDRVLLRPLGPSDTDALFATMDDEELRRLTGTHTNFTREQVERYCNTREGHGDRLDFAVLDPDTEQLVGELAIMDLSPENRGCAFRIGIHASATGRGMGTEATQLVLAHLFAIGVHRVSLEVFDFNPRARHVYEKVGFVHEGTLRHALRWDNEWIDAHVMSILAPH